MWAKFAHGIPPGFPDFIFYIFYSVFVFRPGIFVPLDSRSAARCARAPQLAQSWDCFLSVFAGNIEGTVNRSIDL